jgi:hypothetical protein
MPRLPMLNRPIMARAQPPTAGGNRPPPHRAGGGQYGAT